MKYHQTKQTLLPLINIITRHCFVGTETEVPLEGITIFKHNAPSIPSHYMVPPSAVFVLQGAKEMVLGNDRYIYDSSSFLITSLDLPANSSVIEATKDTPCVGVIVPLDMQLITEMLASGEVAPPKNKDVNGCIGINETSNEIIDALSHLLSLLDDSDEARSLLAPLFKKELHYRLLTSKQAARLYQIASISSKTQKIGQAIEWLKLNYNCQLRIIDLADRVQMSTATLHYHFRQLTSMSPLQYQKWLRLNEARRLMLNHYLDASVAGYNVGYDSPSQFSREYRRLFGLSPKKDIKKLREQYKVNTN